MTAATWRRIQPYRYRTRPRYAKTFPALPPGLFLTSVHPSGRYPLDQNGKPYFIQGASPQDMAVLGTTSSWTTYFSTMKAQGVNSVQVHLMVSDTGGMQGNPGFLDVDGNAPFTSMSTFSGPVSAYWSRIDTMFATAATYGITVWASPAEDVTCGSTIGSMTTGQCFAFGQFIGARYKNQPNIVWSFGNDYDSTDQAARDGKYLQVLAGIRDQGDTHLVTMWGGGNGDSPWNDANWDPKDGTGADLMFSYGGVIYSAVQTAYDDTSTTAPKPVFEGEAHYDGEPVGTPTSLHELRGQAWWAITSGACGHFYGQHHTWAWDSSRATEFSNTFALQIAQVVALVPTLTTWWSLVPDESHVFLTGGRGTDTGDPSNSTLATASYTPGGMLGLIYFPTSRGSITVATSKLSGTVTAYWFDPTNGATSSESNPAAPTHPGTNAAGDGDFVLVLQGTSAPQHFRRSRHRSFAPLVTRRRAA